MNLWQESKTELTLYGHQLRYQTILFAMFPLLFSCGDPLVDGRYLGEPLGEIEVLIQPYQTIQGKSTEEEEWRSLESLCLEQSDRCLFSQESPECQLERSQCVQEKRSEIRWIRNPNELTFGVIWVPISYDRSENATLSFIEQGGDLPQSLLVRENSAAPFPSQGKFHLYETPPEQLMSLIDLTHQAHLAQFSKLSNVKSALGIMIAYQDRNENQQYDPDEELVGLALDQGLLFSILPTNLSGATLERLHIKPKPQARQRGFLNRVSYPFCSPPNQWVLPDPTSLPMTISLMELDSCVLNVELEQYTLCEAGVSPQCASTDDLNEVCSPSSLDSELCHQCYDQLLNQYCGRMISRCVNRLIDDDDMLCFALSEACQLRSTCFRYDRFCEQAASLESTDPDWACTTEEIADCYQETSCLVKTVIDEDLMDGLLDEENDGLEEFVEEVSPTVLNECRATKQYTEWVENHLQCSSPLAISFNLNEEDLGGTPPDNDCFFKSCEYTYILCEREDCETEYLECITLENTP